MDNYYPPIYKEKAFNCPHCGAYALQIWDSLLTVRDCDEQRYGDLVSWVISVKDLDVSSCYKCNKYSIWYNKQMIYPDRGNAPMPNPDLPDDIKADYEEAASIANRSPRGAAALLRLVIQKLCIYLGEKGENLNTDIGNMVKNGLPETIQRALDTIRVIGNDAVHPGTMDLKDDTQTVESLFKLINIIAEHMITQPKHIDGLYETLPDSKKDAIAKRDGK